MHSFHRFVLQLLEAEAVNKHLGLYISESVNLIFQMSMLLTTLEKQVEDKGKELVAYREKFNIRLQNEQQSAEPQTDKTKSHEESKSSGVLVNS